MRLGEIMAYEVSKTLPYQHKVIETPMEKCEVQTLSSYPVLLILLRAGLSYGQGFLNYFDRSSCGFIGLFRREEDRNLAIQMDYVSLPAVRDQDVVLVDPMLATGMSLLHVLERIAPDAPARVHIASLIASPEGIDYIINKCPVPVTVWTHAIDDKLDDRFFIVPGLGDAGDLSFGEKI